MHYYSGEQTLFSTWLNFPADLVCLLWSRGWYMFTLMLWRFRICFWVISVINNHDSLEIGGSIYVQTCVSCAIHIRRYFCAMGSRFYKNFADIFVLQNCLVKKSYLVPTATRHRLIIRIDPTIQCIYSRSSYLIRHFFSRIRFIKLNNKKTKQSLHMSDITYGIYINFKLNL